MKEAISAWGNMRKTMQELERLRKKQRLIAGKALTGPLTKVKKEAKARKAEIAILEGQRASLEIELEYNALELLSCAGLIDDGWNMPQVKNGKLCDTIRRLLDA